MGKTKFECSCYLPGISGAKGTSHRLRKADKASPPKKFRGIRLNDSSSFCTTGVLPVNFRNFVLKKRAKDEYSTGKNR